MKFNASDAETTIHNIKNEVSESKLFQEIKLKLENGEISLNEAREHVGLQPIPYSDIKYKQMIK